MLWARRDPERRASHGVLVNPSRADVGSSAYHYVLGCGIAYFLGLRRAHLLRLQEKHDDDLSGYEGYQ